MIKLSKKLCYILRHNPASIGLSIDKNGYADINELIGKLRLHGVNISKSNLAEIVASDEKSRYSYNEDKTKIRANYGHSFAVDLEFKALCPPPVLYHGTAKRNVESILENGLDKSSRNYVHLTDNISSALDVGGRYGKAVIFKIDACRMFRKGYAFYKSGAVWLTEHVPTEYLSLLRETVTFR